MNAVLLFAGDILGAYGVLLFLGVWMVRWKGPWLIVTALFFLLLVAVPGEGSSTISTDPPDLSMLPPDVATLLVERAQASLFVSSLGPAGLVGPFALGLWAGRRRILQEPENHRLLLWIVALVGIGAAVLGAQPMALVHAGLRAVPDQARWRCSARCTTRPVSSAGPAVSRCSG